MAKKQSKSSKTAKTKAAKKKPQKAAKPTTKKVARAAQLEEGMRGIVRIAGMDVPGDLTLKRAILRIKGIGHSISKAVLRVLEGKVGVKPEDKVGFFDDDKIEKIDAVLFSLDDSVIPAYMLNRNKDPLTGKTKHVIMNDLQFAIRQDIEAKKRSRSWQGYRHAKGQKVRGQRTKNTGRKGIAMGVMKKKK